MIKTSPRVSVRGDYLHGTNLALRQNGFIDIEDGRITRLRTAVEVEKQSSSDADVETISFPGCMIVPALSNAHVHLRDAIGAEAATGLPLSAAVMGPNSIRAKSITNASRSQRILAIRCTLEHMIACGVALVGDFCDGGVAGVEEVRLAALGLDIEVVIFGRLFESIRDMEFPIERLTLSHHRELEQVLAVADGFSTATVNDYSDSAWCSIVEVARRQMKLVAVHAAEHADHTSLSVRRTGRTDVERALGYGVDHVVHLTSATLETLAPVIAARCCVVMCPRSNALTGAGWPPLDTLLAAGVPVALGTDNVMLNSGNVWRELEFSSKCAKTIRKNPAAIDSRDLLISGTLNGARALVRANDTGSIDVGKWASMVVVQMDVPPLKFTCDPFSTLIHRVEQTNIVGHFFRGRWQPNHTGG